MPGVLNKRCLLTIFISAMQNISSEFALILNNCIDQSSFDLIVYATKYQSITTGWMLVSCYYCRPKIKVTEIEVFVCICVSSSTLLVSSTEPLAHW